MVIRFTVCEIYRITLSLKMLVVNIFNKNKKISPTWFLVDFGYVILQKILSLLYKTEGTDMLNTLNGLVSKTEGQ